MEFKVTIGGEDVSGAEKALYGAGFQLVVGGSSARYTGSDDPPMPAGPTFVLVDAESADDARDVVREAVGEGYKLTAERRC